MNPIFLVLIFLVSALLGYLVIKTVPSLLHTPLMTGMNALAAICILGAMVSVGYSWQQGGTALVVGQIVGGFGLVIVAINVVAGFGVTNRMLQMFNPKKKSSK